MAELTALHTLTAQMKREGIRRLLVLSGEEGWFPYTQVSFRCTGSHIRVKLRNHWNYGDIFLGAIIDEQSNVSRLFHTLGSVQMVDGCAKMANGKFERTLRDRIGLVRIRSGTDEYPGCVVVMSNGDDGEKTIHLGPPGCSV